MFSIWWLVFCLDCVALVNCQYASNPLYESKNIFTFQFRGTHNSYHGIATEYALPTNGGDFEDYSLTSQLDNGIRALELDAHPCDEGNYRDILGVCTNWPVFHIGVFDKVTNCNDLISCISEIRDWSYEYRNNHFPLFIKIELKGAWTAAHYTTDLLQLSKTISDTMAQSYDNNEDPILLYSEYYDTWSHSWKNVLLSDMRGKFIFFLPPADSENVLIYNSVEYSLTNGWPDSSDFIFWASCSVGNANDNFDNNDYYCAITEGGSSIPTNNNNAGKYLLTSLVDSSFYQREDHGFFFQVGNTDISNPDAVYYIENGVTISKSHTSWLNDETFDNIDSSRKTPLQTTANTLSTATECELLPRQAANDGKVFDCELYEFVKEFTLMEIAAAMLNALPGIRTQMGIITNYFSNGDELLTAMKMLPVIDMEEDGWNTFFGNRYDTNEQLTRASNRVAVGINIIFSDYPFGTPNTISFGPQYEFSLITDSCSAPLSNYDIDAPARTKGECLIFDTPSQYCQDINGNLQNCTDGKPMDLIQ